MAFICDYALIDPMTLIYRVDNVGAKVFATYEDIDENCFCLDVFFLGEDVSDEDILKVTDTVRDYLFNE